MRWQKEKDPLIPGRTGEHRPSFPVFGIALLAGVLTFSAFLLWDDSEGTGDISRAVSYFEEFFDQNGAIAVFLGWEGE